MVMSGKFSILLLLLFSCFNVFPENNVLRLVYKDIGNLPYMETSPDNSGLYRDLMEKACKKIGFELEIIRLHKKRAYRLLETGGADLYASGEFRTYRSEFLYYFPNGLHRHEVYVGLTSIDIPELSSISDINRYGLEWVVELGSSWPLDAGKYGVRYNEMKDTRIKRAVELLMLGRPFFFKTLKEDVDDYIECSSISSMEDIGIRVHPDCAPPTIAPLYASFSRFSRHYREEKNPFYDADKPLSAENFPYRPERGSVPHRLEEALHEMIMSGEVDSIADRYDIE